MVVVSESQTDDNVIAGMTIARVWRVTSTIILMMIYSVRVDVRMFVVLSNSFGILLTLLTAKERALNDKQLTGNRT